MLYVLAFSHLRLYVVAFFSLDRYYDGLRLGRRRAATTVSTPTFNGIHSQFEVLTFSYFFSLYSPSADVLRGLLRQRDAHRNAASSTDDENPSKRQRTSLSHSSHNTHVTSSSSQVQSAGPPRLHVHQSAGPAVHHHSSAGVCLCVWILVYGLVIIFWLVRYDPVSSDFHVFSLLVRYDPVSSDFAGS